MTLSLTASSSAGQTPVRKATHDEKHPRLKAGATTANAALVEPRRRFGKHRPWKAAPSPAISAAQPSRTAHRERDEQHRHLKAARLLALFGVYKRGTGTGNTVNLGDSGPVTATVGGALRGSDADCTGSTLNVSDKGNGEASKASPTIRFRVGAA